MGREKKSRNEINGNASLGLPAVMSHRKMIVV